MIQRRRKKRREAFVRVAFRLYRGQDDDLIEWITPLGNLPYGLKTQQIRDTLRWGIGMQEQGVAGTRTELDLAEVRHVVEAAVISALARFEGEITAPVAQANEEAEDLLDALGDNLIIQDEGEVNL